jgi:3-oxoacyl-[acyl-carrier-protein] synthase II
MELKRVVVTGLGAITPLGHSVEETWENMKNGVSGANEITAFDTEKFKTKFACEVKDFDVKKYIDRKEARRLDRYAQFAMIAADQAYVDAGLNEENVDPDRAGVIWGSGIGGIETFVQEVTNFNNGDGTPKFNPFFIPKMIADIAAGHISMKYNMRGPNYAPVAACATSTVALVDAFNLIRLGKADVFMSGGSEASINPAGMGGFISMHALSTNNEEYATASRPFDSNRDGFVMGEGGCAIVLEEYEHAVKRGAKIYAEVIGGGLTADAHHLTAPHPEGLGAANVMKQVLEDAEMDVDQVDYINVHGTSTPLGDLAEIKAIQTLFGEHAYNLNISSTKSMTGHLLGAAGAVEAVASILAIRDGVVPPTINNTNRDERIDEKLNLTLNKAQKRDIKVAISNTFGFGGHNASIGFKKYNS